MVTFSQEELKDGEIFLTEDGMYKKTYCEVDSYNLISCNDPNFCSGEFEFSQSRYPTCLKGGPDNNFIAMCGLGGAKSAWMCICKSLDEFGKCGGFEHASEIGKKCVKKCGNDLECWYKCIKEADSDGLLLECLKKLYDNTANCIVKWCKYARYEKIEY